MSYFKSLLEKHGLHRHDGRPLWQYNITEEGYKKLKQTIKLTSLYKMDARDACLFYSEWWKFEYNGGFPSKRRIFDSLDKQKLHYEDDVDWFYDLAKKGGSLIGLKWIKRYNTFYFRTLLLQGGLPVKQIESNRGVFLKFLGTILRLQPECVEDFSLIDSVVNILPSSSQNENIYEICFVIVRHVLDKNEREIEKLRESSPSIAAIIDYLIGIKIQPVNSRIKPQNIWILNLRKDKKYIYLKLVIKPTYTQEKLSSLLEQEIDEQEYQLFVEEHLICKFNKMLSGNYKTNFFPHKRIDWNGISAFPVVTVYCNDEITELNNFIHLVPDTNKPSLWTKHSDGEWKLVKGSNTSNKEGAVLFPEEWSSHLVPEVLEHNEITYNWMPFEGEITLTNGERTRSFLSGVDSYDWTIISEKPNWLKRSNLPIVRKKPSVLVYNKVGDRLKTKDYQLFYKKSKSENSEWSNGSELRTLPIGVVDLKIEVDGVLSYDAFYNIGNFKMKIENKSLQSSTLKVVNSSSLNLQLVESPNVTILKEDNGSYNLNVGSGLNKIPISLKAILRLPIERKLHFEIDSPFEGLALLDSEGIFLTSNDKLSFSSLVGLRILCKTSNEEGSYITFSNKLKPYIKIVSKLQKNIQPLLFFRDEIRRLFSLVDVMNHKNEISCILSSGKETIEYTISNFNYNVKQNKLDKYTIDLENAEEDLSLYAIPLNCSNDNIQLIPLVQKALGEMTVKSSWRSIKTFDELLNVKDKEYQIPKDVISHQLIVFSSVEGVKRVMPRFVNLDDGHNSISKSERIVQYHDDLSKAEFGDEIWKQLLSYFLICQENELPFTTLDQITAITGSSKVAARAFFYLGMSYSDSSEFILNIIPRIENELGFDFHWIYTKDWQDAINEINSFYGAQFFKKYIEFLSEYLNSCGLSELLQFISHNKCVEISPIHHAELMDVRSQLGERVLRELPTKGIPNITDNYNIQIERNYHIRLLLHSPISVAESLTGENTEFPIFGGDDFRATIRRNIQYSKFLNPALYKRLILQVLNILN